MKKKISILIAVLVLIGVAVYASQAVMEAIAEPQIDPSLLPNEQLIVSKNDALKELKKKLKKDKKAQPQVEKYAYFVNILKPTKAEKEYIDHLITKEYDAEILIKIYEFWQYTAEDIGIIEKVYDLNPHNEKARYWIEDGFLLLSERGETKYSLSGLSYEEVEAYHKNDGLSFDEIMVADCLSRKGNKHVKDILNAKKEGASWYMLADDVYGLSKANGKIDKEKKQKYEKIEDGNEILSCMRMSRTTGKEVVEFLDQAAEGEDLTERQMELEGELMEQAREQLEVQDVWVEQPPEQIRQEDR